jgi:hypothetical protein
MISLSGNAQSSLLEALVFANTPGYVFRKFSVNATVTSLSIDSDADLVDELQNLLDKDDWTVADLVTAYALFVAAILKMISPVRLAALRGLARLRWAPGILRSQPSYRTTTNVSELEQDSRSLVITPSSTTTTHTSGLIFLPEVYDK